VATLSDCLLLMITITRFVACRKITGCATYADGNEYLIELPIKLYPAIDTFDIGDTLWIEQVFHDQVHDQRNNMSLDFKNYSFINRITTGDLMNPYHFSIKQDFTAEIGVIEPTGVASLRIGYVHEQDTFRFKARMVMTERGLYKIGFLPFVDQKNVDFTRCPNEYLDLRTDLNGKGDNNYHMMQYSTDSLTRQATKEVYVQIGSYCFYVR
jgi:hypothetical protein